jgi:hypothetical protein
LWVAEQRLGLLQKQPLTAKMVEEILSITAAERRRWSKDGRIPHSGRASFGQGKQKVSLFAYSSEVISKLAARPQQIAEWRRCDRETAAVPFHRESSLAR